MQNKFKLLSNKNKNIFRLTTYVICKCTVHRICFEHEYSRNLICQNCLLPVRLLFLCLYLYLHVPFHIINELSSKSKIFFPSICYFPHVLKILLPFITNTWDSYSFDSSVSSTPCNKILMKNLTFIHLRTEINLKHSLY